MSDAGENKKRKFHLPEVKLKTFGGDLKHWLGWWSQFEKFHLDEDLHPSDKFQCLAQCMEVGSEAKQIVDSYPQTAENYEKAVEALRERFGRQDLLLQVYVRELLSLVIGNVSSKEKLPLSQLYVQLESHLRSLAELNLNNADPATWLFPMVESSLSEGTLRAWQRSTQCKTDGAMLVPQKSRLQLLMDFMKAEVQCDQQISLAKQGFHSKPPTHTLQRVNRGKPKLYYGRGGDVPTAAGLINLQANGCGFCGKPHDSDKCFRAERMTLEEKRGIIRGKNLCFQCLSSGHVRRTCKMVVKCGICSGKHYSIMCPVSEKAGVEREHGVSSNKPAYKKRRIDGQLQEDLVPTPRTFHQNSNQCSRMVLMNTLKVKVADQDGKQWMVRLVGDNGSQRSYVSSDIIEKTGCTWVEDEWLQNILFGGSVTPPQKFARHELTLLGLNGNEMSLELLGKEKLTGQIQEVPSGPWINVIGSERSDTH